MVPRSLKKSTEEGCRAPHLILSVKAFEIEDCGNPMHTNALACCLQASLGVLFRVNYEMPELVCQCDEIALRVDDRLLDPGNALFQKPAQQMGFAGTGITLNEQSRGEQFLKVQRRRNARRCMSDLDSSGHLPTQTFLQKSGIINPVAHSRAYRLAFPATA